LRLEEPGLMTKILYNGYPPVCGIAAFI